MIEFQAVIETWNINLFTLVNAAPGAHPWTVDLARVLADWPVWAAVLIVLFLWVRGTTVKRQALLATGLGLAISLAGAFTIAALWPHPRPAELGIGQQFMRHSAEPSFPSDHATFLLSIGFGFIATGAVRRWGWLITALGIGTAWARVYLGVHFPLDMLGALGLALIAAVVAGTAKLWLTVTLLPLIERLYEVVLRTLHLPAAIFPRTKRVATRTSRKHRS